MRKIILSVLGALLLLVVGVVLLVVFNLDPLINDQREMVASIASDQLGRKATFGPVTTSFSNGLAARFTDIQLSGQKDGAPAQMSIESVTLKVDLWKAVFSLGKDLEVQEFIISKPVIRATRFPDGTWDFEDIPRHLASKAPKEPPTKEDVAAATDPDALKGLRIAGVAIKDARLELDDQMLGRKMAVGSLNLQVTEIVPGQDVGAVLDLVLDDGRGKTAPFHLDTTMKPLPANFDFSVIPATALKVTLGTLDLESWSALLPPEALIPAGGTLSLDLNASTNRGAEVAQAKGFVELKDLVLRKGKVSGAKSTIRVELDADANVKEQRYDVRKLDVTAPAVTLETRVNLTEPSPAGIKNANIELKVSNLERVVAILPAGAGLLPPELTLEGPFEVAIKGDSAKGGLRVDMDKAHVAWADVLNKQAGTPLHLAVQAERHGDRIKIPSLELLLDNAKVSGTADVSTKKGAPLEATLDTGPVVLANMKGIFPPFAKALQKGMSVNGVVRLEANAKAAGDKQEAHAKFSATGMDVQLEKVSVKGNAQLVADVLPSSANLPEAHAKLALSGLDVRVDKTTVKGDALLNADALPNGTTTNAGLDATLSGLELMVMDAKGAPLVEKPMGFKTELAVRVIHTPQNATVEKADITLGSTVIMARGRVDGLDKKSPSLDVKVDRLDVAFDDLRTVAAPARVLPQGGHLTASVAVLGDPSRLETMQVSVKDLQVLAAKNRVAGNILVKNLTTPLLDVKLDTVDLNFDELRKLAKNDSIPPGGILKAKVAMTADLSRLSTLDVKVDGLDTTIYKSRIQGHAYFRDVDAPQFDVRLAGDKLDLNEILKLTGGDKKEEPKAKEPEKKNENPHGLPKETREMLKKLTGKVDVAVGTVLYDKYVLEDVKGILRMKDGVANFETLSLKTYGGVVQANGTSVDNSGEWMQSALKLKVINLDLARLGDDQASTKGALGGRLDVDVDVRAKGMTSDDMMMSLEGPVNITSKQLTVKGFNLLYALNTPIARMVPIAGFLKGKDVDPKASTSFENIGGGGRFEAGKVIISRPVKATTPFGALQLEGTAWFDSRINFVGTTEINPETVGRMTGGKYKPASSVMTPIRIGGTWKQPIMEGVDVSTFLQGAGLKELLGNAAAMAETARKELEEQAAAAREAAEKARAEAEARIRAQADQAAEAARKQAEDAKHRAEDAKRAAEDAVRQRAEEAKRAQEDATRKAEAARKAAEDDARKRAEDAKRRAEEEKKRLEDEARRKADEAAKKAKDQLKGLFR